MLQQIANRASVRAFTTQAVEHSKIEELLKAAMAAPSAGNQQPWEFYVTESPSMREQLAACSPYAKPCLAAPVVIVPCMKTADVRFPDYAPQDVSAAIENLLIECVNQDLGAVWMGIAPREDRIAAAQEVLKTPAGLVPFAFIAVGYPATHVEAHGPQRFREDCVHYL